MKKSLVVPLFTLLLVSGTLRLIANPLGGAVQAGSATISHNGPGWLTVNQASDKVIIDWNSFSIGAGEVTRFLQPGANSAALNRVLGGNPTAIYGLLQGNGQIFVINPAGILVGRSGVINTHSFAGSTLDVTDASFLSGVGIRFSGTSTAAVRNEGTIQALGGDIFLFAHKVENAGSLNAAGGTVGLGAGSEILLSQSGNERVSVRAGNVNAPVTEKGVDNVGAVQAATAELKAAGGNIYALAINNGGIVRATTVVNEGGRIYLRAAGGNVQNTGTLDASGKNGGSVVVEGGHNTAAPSTVISSGAINALGQNGVGGDVKVLGDHVALAGSATIDASGLRGGGNVRVGGDLHGANPGIQNAERTFISPAAAIAADAQSSGDGGKVVVWSEKGTRFYGSISARGGSLGGNGGSAEVSGRESLSYLGNSDLRSPHGKLGTLLLDPDTIRITDTANNGGDLDPELTVTTDPNLLFTEPNMGANTLSRGQLEVFGATENVVVEAKDGITMDPLASHTLNLAATTGSLTLHADGNNDGVGNFSMDAADTILTHGGALSISGVGVTIANITTTGGGDLHGGNVTLAASGALSISGNITAKGGTAGNNKDGQAGGVVTLSGSSISLGGNIDTSGSAGNGPGAHDGGTGGSVSATAPTAIAANSISVNGAITTDGGAAAGAGTAGAAGSVTLTGNTLNLNGNAAAGSTTVPFNTTVNAIVLNKTGGVVIHETDAVSISGTTSAGVDLTAGGSVSQSALLSVGGPAKFTLSAANSDLLLGGFANLFNGGVTLAFSGAGTLHNLALRDASLAPTLTGLPAAFNDLTLRYDNTGINLAALALTGNLDITAGGNISQSGLLNIGGTSKFTVTAASSDVQLGLAANLFNGGVTLAVSGAGTMHDALLWDGSATPVLSGLPATFHNLTLRYDNPGLIIPAVAVAGNLDVTSGGVIKQSGLLNVTGTSKFTVTAANSDVLLGGFGNLFNGGVTLAVSGVGTLRNVALRDASATPALSGLPANLNNLTLSYDNSGIDLPATALTGNLDVTAGGNITQSGLLQIGGTSKFTVTAGSSDVLLGGFANLFSGGVTLAVSGIGTIHDVILWDASATPVLNGLPAALHNLTQRYDNTAPGIPAVAVTGNLDVSSGGNITENGILNVTGTSKFTVTAASSDVLLGGFANLFNGGVTLAVSGVGTIRDVSLRNAAATPTLTGLPAALRDLTLHYDNAGVNLPALNLTGDLNVTVNGPITQGGTLKVNGAGKTATFNAPGNNINLSDPNNDFTTVSFTAADVDVMDQNALTLGASTISGHLNVTAGGLLNDSGNVTVAGTTSLAVGPANDINLVNADDFGGAVSIVSGHNVTIKDQNSINLGPSTIAGTLDVTSGGNGTPGAQITQSGILSVGGLSTFHVAANNSDVLVGDFPNLFNGVALATAGGSFQDVSIWDAAAVPIFVTGLPVALRDLTLRYDNSGVNLPALNLSGKLKVTANGPIADVGAVSVNGTTSLAAGAGNNITLIQADDFGGAVSILSANDVTLTDVNALNLGASTISGNLNVTAGGSISQSGLLDVSGAGKTATFNAPAGADILLASFPNLLGPVTINVLGLGSLHDLALWNALPTAALTGLPLGGLHSLTLEFDATPIDLPAVTLSGDLSVTAPGITDSGNLSVAGTTTLVAAGAGHDIVLDNADDFGGPVTLTGGRDVTLNDVNALTVGGVVSRNLITASGADTIFNTLHVFGNLNTVASGAINDAGNVTIGGTTSLTAGPGNDIKLDNADDFGGLVTIAGARDVTLNDVNTLTVGGGVGRDLNLTSSGSTTLSTLNVVANLTVSAGGLISDVGNVTVAGATLLAPGGNNVALDNADDFGGPVRITSANNVTLNDVSALEFGASTLTGNLDVTAGGAITQSGAVVANGAGKTASFNAPAANIALADGNNDFTTAKFNGANVVVRDVNGLDLGASTVTGDLDVTAGGAVTQSGTILANGAGKTASFNAVGNSITLGDANNDFATTKFSGADVTVNDLNAVDLGVSTVTGNLTVTAGGPITQSGAVVVNGLGKVASFIAVGNPITLPDPNNDFTTAKFTGSDVVVNDVNALDLGASTASGNLNVRAGGSITQSGLLDVSGAGKTATFTASPGADVLLDSFANLLGPVTINVAGLGSLHDLALRSALPGAALTGLPLGGLHNLTLQFDVTPIDLPAVTLSGDLSVTAPGITDSGSLVVAGTTTLVAAGAGHDIVLDNADDFGGPVTVNSGRDTTLTDVNGLEVGGVVGRNLTTTSGAGTILNNLHVVGNLTTTANGLINDAGVVTVLGSATFGAGGANDVLMTQGDDFGGAVTIASARDVSLTDVNTLTVGGIVGRDLTTTAGGSTTLNAVTVGRNLSITAGGLISDNGNVVVAGTTSLAAGAGNNITLDNADDFVGAVSIVSGKDVTLNDINALTVGGAVAEDLTTTAAGATTLNAVTVGRNLSVTANGLISDNGAVVVTGTASLAAGVGNNITLDNADDFGGAVSIVSGKDVTLNDINALTVGGAVAEDLTTTAAGATTLNAVTVGRNLSVTANGLISDNGAVVVTGTASLAAGVGNNITLDNADDLGGAVSIVSGKDVALNDINALTVGGAVAEDLTTTAAGATTLNAVTVGRNLSVTANGLISDNGAVVVTGTASLAAGVGNNITLDNADDLGGAVSIVSGKDVALNDINALTVGGAVAEDLTTTAAGATTLNAVTVGRNLSATANGLISDNGAVVVTGTTSLAAGAGNNVTLDNADDFGGAVSIVSGKDVTLNDINALTLGVSTVSGNLTVTANGLISDNGNVTVAGTTSLAAGVANNITLDNADDFVGAVSIVNGKDVTLNDVNALTLGASTVSGNLTVTANGLISDNGNVTVAGTTSLAAGAANNITLDNADDFVGAVSIVNGKDVTLNDINALSLGASSVGGNLKVTANGLISDSGNVTVAGTTSLAAGVANNITLDNADDFVGAVSIVSGKDVTLNDINALTLGASAVGGNLKVTANGLISDSGNVTVAGTTSLAAGVANNITLDNADDFIGAVSIVSGKDVTLNDVNALTLGASTVSGNLTVTANGLISDSGNVTVAGTTSLAAGAANNITLDNADDFVGAVSIVSGKDVTLNDVNALTLGASTVAGNLTVTANGLISDSGNVTVAGTTSLAAGPANNITLDNANDFVGAVSIVSGKDVTLNDVNALTLGASTVAGNLTVTANGLISDSGNVTVAGTTSLAAGAANSITLDNADDFVGAVSIVSGKDVTLNDINALTLGASTVSGNLTVTANGLISDSGNVTVAGTTSLAAGAANNITLDNADDFVGAVSIVSGKDVTLNDINALTLGASTVSGNLTVTANGLISDSGNVTVAGTTSLAAGAANNITLDNADDFVGAVSIASGKDVTLNDINALTLGASTVAGNLTVTAKGLISDSGNVTVAGTTSLAAGPANNITLDNANDFVGAVSIVSGNDVTLNDINALTLGASTVSGNLTVTANGLISDSGNVTVAGTTSLAAGTANNITFSQADDFVGAVSIVSGKDVTLNDINALTLGASTVSGNLTVTANGLISDSGNVTVAGATRLAAGAANNITLDNADDFVGAVSIVNGKDVTLNDVNALTLGASTVSGNLTVTANGLISDNGNVTVAGTTSLAAGAANSITLDNADDFVGAVSIVSGKDVTLNDINALTLGASTVSGNLTVTANGLISDSGNVTVAGTTSLAAGAGNSITLDNADDFVGAVSIASGKDVTLNDINALTLGASTVAGNLTVTAKGLISDSGNVTVAGTTSLAAGPANNITLDNANDFVGAVSIVSGKDVTLNDINALTLGASTVSGNLTVTANGLISDSGNVTVAGTTSLAAGAANNITLDNADDFVGAVSIVSGKDVTLNDINALTLGASTVSGNLTVTANGLISDSGNVTVAGTTSLAAGAANNITLDNADDFVGAVSIVNGKDVTLNDVNALTLGASTVSGNLTVTANGLISDNGNVTVAGTTSLAAGAANNITLDNADDFVGAVSIVSGKDVTLNDVNALTLGASTVAGNLTVTANGLISDSGNVTVAGTTSLAAGAANSITLDNADDFVGAVSIVSGKDVTLNDINALTLGASTVSGNLTVTANGLISDSGNVTVAGATRLAAGAGNSITLDNADDFVGAVSIVSGKDVTLNDINALTLGASTVSGNLTVTANGLISDSGNVTVAGTTSLAAGTANNITFSQADDFVGAVSIVSGKDVTLNDINALTLGASTVSGNLTVTANGLISDSGSVTVAGTTSLAAGAANSITLDNADDFVGAVSIVSGKDVTLNDINALTLGASTVSGNLTVTANGLISDSGNVTVAGATRLAAGAGNSITLDNADDFVGAVSIVSGKDVTLNDINALTLGASTVSGNLTVTANGLISDSGNVTVAGTTSLAAGTANNITFSQADDFVGAVSIVSGKDVTLNDINALTLGASTVSGNLTVTANGLISDSGSVTVAGTTSLAAGTANNITFSQADDFVGAVSIVSGKDVTLNDINALTLGASTVSGNLTVTANGLISDSGNVTVAGATRLAAGAGNSITLDNADDFVGAVSIVSGKDVTLNDINALTLGASTVSGNLTVTANGLISDSGNVTVAGTTSLAAGTANNITFSQADDFVGAVSIVSGKDVTLNDINALTLGASTVSGNLTVTANGLISDSGSVTVAGTTSLAAGTANNITFSQADDFVGAVSIVSGKDVTLNDINALTLGASTVSGNLTVTANGLISDSGSVTVAGTTSLAAGTANNITFSQADDFVGAVSIVSGKDVTLNDVNALTLGASTVSGNLTVTANGLISDSGNVTVAGTTSLAAGTANNITFSQADDFVGAVSIVSGKDVTLNDVNALTLGASTVSGNLTVTANGLISDSGNVTVAGTTSLAAGAANNITLDNADDFVGAVSIVSGKDVTLNDVNALTLGASTVSGNLTVTANGLISDSGNVTVAGTTSLAAGAANNITLDNADDFVGAVSIVSGKDVTLNDINALTLGVSTVSGNLTVTANGLISDSGNVTVAGTTSLATGAANNITLDNADDFVGAVSIVSGKDVTLNDINALTLGVSTVSGNLTVTANGLISDSGNVTVAGTTSLAAGAANNITLDNADDFVGAVSIVSGKDVTLNDINALTLGSSTVSGNLAITANGLISDSGNVTVAGSTSLAAGAGNNITFSHADDFGGSVSIVSGNDVTLNDINALALGASAISGNLTVTANGLISDSGDIAVAGTTSLAAGTGNNINLNNADDFIGSVSVISGNDVTLNDVNALTLGAST